MTTTEVCRARIEALKRLSPDIEDYYSKILPFTLNSNDDKITTLRDKLQKFQNNVERLRTNNAETATRYEEVNATYNQILEEDAKLTREINDIKNRIGEMKEKSGLKAENDKQMIEKLKKYKSIQQRLIKFKWLAIQLDQDLEAIIYNDKSAYFKYCTFDKEDPALREKIWTEIAEASHSASDLLKL